MKYKLKGLVKLHLYDEAQIQQMDIDELYKQQLSKWFQKIEQTKAPALNVLRGRQNEESEVFDSKIITYWWENQKAGLKARYIGEKIHDQAEWAQKMEQGDDKDYYFCFSQDETTEMSSKESLIVE